MCSLPGHRDLRSVGCLQFPEEITSPSGPCTPLLLVLSAPKRDGGRETENMNRRQKKVPGLYAFPLGPRSVGGGERENKEEIGKRKII